MSLNPNQRRQRRTESRRRKRQEKKRKPNKPSFPKHTMLSKPQGKPPQRTTHAVAPKVPRAPRVPSLPTKRADKPQSFLSSALQRFSVAIPVLFMMLAVLVDCGSHDNGPPPLKEGTIQTLGPNDEIYFTDGVGSLAEQMSADGTTLKGSFAAYPYGVTRYDTSNETRKYAGTPYDKIVGLNQMGARSYAPDLGVWTSPDPVGLWNPERGIGQSFSHNNPYAYGANSPIQYVDKDGHWAILVAIGVGIGVWLTSQYANAPESAKAPVYNKGPLEMTVDMAHNGATGGAIAALAAGSVAIAAERGLVAAGTQLATRVAAGTVASTGMHQVTDSVDPSGNLGKAADVALAVQSIVPSRGVGARIGPAARPKGAKAPDVVTANGQRAAADGTRLGPSGKPEFHYSNSATRKQVIDGAKAQGSGQIVKDSAGSVQPEHWHALDQNGERVSGPGKTHFNVRGAKPKPEE